VFLFAFGKTLLNWARRLGSQKAGKLGGMADGRFARHFFHNFSPSYLLTFCFGSDIGLQGEISLLLAPGKKKGHLNLVTL
jgi:hypothetical protein